MMSDRVRTSIAMIALFCGAASLGWMAKTTITPRAVALPGVPPVEEPVTLDPFSSPPPESGGLEFRIWLAGALVSTDEGSRHLQHRRRLVVHRSGRCQGVARYPATERGNRPRSGACEVKALCNHRF